MQLRHIPDLLIEMGVISLNDHRHGRKVTGGAWKDQLQVLKKSSTSIPLSNQVGENGQVT